MQRRWMQRQRWRVGLAAAAIAVSETTNVGSLLSLSFLLWVTVLLRHDKVTRSAVCTLTHSLNFRWLTSRPRTVCRVRAACQLVSVFFRFSSLSFILSAPNSSGSLFAKLSVLRPQFPSSCVFVFVCCAFSLTAAKLFFFDLALSSAEMLWNGQVAKIYISDS